MKTGRVIALGAAVLASCGLLAECASKQPAVRAVFSRPAAYRAASAIDVAEVVYDGKLADGWDDWGWGEHHLEPGKPAEIAFGAYGGIILHHADLAPAFGGLSFRYKTKTDYGDFLEVSLQYRQVDEHVLPPIAVERRHVALLAGGFKEVLIPFSELDPSGSPFDRIQIRARTSVPADLVSIDHLMLTKGSRAANAVTPTPAERTVDVQIKCNAPGRPISPLIYGIASTDFGTGAPTRRIGGNPLSRLNWDLGNAYNTGSDWYFENVATKGTLPEWIDEDVAHGVTTALVVPMIGWVAKDTSSVGFPVSKFGREQQHDPYRADAGNGLSANGKPITPGPPSQTSVEATPETVRRWVEALRDRDKARGKRGVTEYILDNEPGIWSTTHRDVHPSPLTYDELLDRTIHYASAIRRADPDAVIAGPASWGWTGYFYSAKDLVTNHEDRRAHGGTALVPWYLSKLAAYERETGTRLLDVLDVHYYPQAANIYGNAGTDRNTAALRIRSTRALWDPSYVDESWINDRVELIPRLERWAKENYPGRGVSLGEWSFGAPEHMSGGLATAEALGRFGQQGLTSAYYWFDLKPGTPAFNAFRLYRNYDGKGARFLDISVPARSEDAVSLFAARDQSGSHITAILLNLDPDATIEAHIDMAECGAVTTKRVFTYASGTGGIVERATKPVGAKVSPVLAPYSMTLVEFEVAK